MKRSGYAELPLHGGRVPHWLAERMTELGTAIAESIIYHYGPSELLTRLATRKETDFLYNASGASPTPPSRNLHRNATHHQRPLVNLQLVELSQPNSSPFQRRRRDQNTIIICFFTITAWYI